MEEKITNHDKYITADDFNKFSIVIFSERLNQAKLAIIIGLNTIKQCVIKIKEKLKETGNSWFKLFTREKCFPVRWKSQLFSVSAYL